ncbi:hypothetical protein [Streptomyces sp. NPDC005955]|jgi:hypothetical protein|uniref:hypothetical protein n=1 Tax=Streptomyces sp. NPDC005955 TaxID=3364738 RepID=UPI003687B5AB
MSLVELIAGADARGLAVSGLACLDRCVPLLGGDDELLRPLWASLGDAGDGAPGADAATWGERLDRVRTALTERAAAQDGNGDGDRGEDGSGSGNGDAVGDEVVRRALAMLSAAPAALPEELRDGASTDTRLRRWADDCSVAALRIHLLLDPGPGADLPAGDAPEGGPDDPLTAPRADRGGELPPLADAELRRQVAVLELLAARGAGGLRQAHAVTTEGRRVLRAVVSRRSRGRN